MHIEGSRVLITGATGGIGHAVARALRASGAKLVLTGRRTDVLAGLANELRAELILCDLADRAAVAELAAAAGDVDILIANAALPASGAVLDFSQDEIDRFLEVNLRAPIALSRALVPGMVDRRRGHVVLVSSLSGLAAAAGSALYSATKFGLRGFAHGLRQDLHGTGVGASVVLPGFIRDAGMFAASGVQLPRGLRTNSPEDVAAGVLRSIVRDRAEVVVAPRELHAAALLGTVAPGFAASMQRRSGTGKITQDLAEGQRHLR